MRQAEVDARWGLKEGYGDLNIVRRRAARLEAVVLVPFVLVAALVDDSALTVFVVSMIRLLVASYYPPRYKRVNHRLQALKRGSPPEPSGANQTVSALTRGAPAEPCDEALHILACCMAEYHLLLLLGVHIYLRGDDCSMLRRLDRSQLGGILPDEPKRM